MPKIFAIGHSTMPVEKFINILSAHDISVLADIRTIPKSRHNPQFNSDNLKISLKKAKIKYVHLKKLGGLRHSKKDSLNTGWRNLSFRGYADYMQTEEFEGGLLELLDLTKNAHNVAIMCAEGNRFRCHRSLVADALTARGIQVLHISSPNSEKVHVLTPFAKVDGASVTYPPV